MSEKKKKNTNRVGTIPFVLRWTLSYGLGWVGLTASFIWLINTNSTFINKLPDLLIVLVLGAIPGLISGLVQQPLIRWKFGTQIKHWWLWSTIGSILAMSGYTLYIDHLDSPFEIVMQHLYRVNPLLEPAILVGVLLLIYSTLQAWALRRYVKRTWLWSLAAFVSASTLVFTSGSIQNIGISGLLGVIFIAGVAGLAQGVVMALTLVWLFGMTRTEAIAQAYDTSRLQAKNKQDENLQDAESTADAILVELEQRQRMESES